MKTYQYWTLFTSAALIVLVMSVFFHDSPTLFLLGTIELVLIAVVVSMFVIIYSQRNWRANPYGRALMYSKISLAILADLSIVTAYLGPDWKYRAVVRVVLFAGILIAQSRLLYLLFSVKNKAARLEYRTAMRREEDKHARSNDRGSSGAARSDPQDLERDEGTPDPSLPG